MRSNAGFTDRILTCRDCGQEFVFSAGEQEFFASRNLTNAPSRCPTCRAARRGGDASSGPRPRTSSGATYEAICADCGRATTVPFMPREDRPVYCSDCYQYHRPARSPRADESRGSYSDSRSGYSDSPSGGRNGGRDRRGDRDRRDKWDRW